MDRKWGPDKSIRNVDCNLLLKIYRAKINDSGMNALPRDAHHAISILVSPSILQSNSICQQRNLKTHFHWWIQ